MPFCHTNLFYKLIIFQELFLIFTKLSLMHRDKKINYIALNAKSKREVYNVLSVERDIYLFPMVDTNRKLMQNVISGNKKSF